MLSYFEGAVPHKCMYIGKLWLEKDFYGDGYFVSGEDSLFSGFKIAGSDIFFYTYLNIWKRHKYLMSSFFLHTRSGFYLVNQ